MRHLALVAAFLAASLFAACDQSEDTSAPAGATSEEPSVDEPSVDKTPMDDQDQMDEPPTDDQDQMDEPPTEDQDQMDEPPTEDEDQMDEPPTDNQDQMEEPPVDEGDQMEAPSEDSPMDDFSQFPTRRISRNSYNRQPTIRRSIWPRPLSQMHRRGLPLSVVQRIPSELPASRHKRAEQESGDYPWKQMRCKAVPSALRHAAPWRQP